MAIVKGRGLIRRAVVGLSEAAEIGRVDNIVFDRDARMSALLIRRRGQQSDLVASSIANVHALGRDIITLEESDQVEGDAKVEELAEFPNLNQLVGCRLITEGGTFLGTVRDVLLDTEEPRITDFDLAGRGIMGRLRGDSIPATGRMRFGKEIVVVPNAVALKRKARIEQRETPAPKPVLVEVVAAELPGTAEQPPVVAEKTRNGEEEGLTRAAGEAG